LRVVAHLALRAARANRAFGADEKNIRAESAAMDKGNNVMGLFLHKIVDCMRMRCSSACNRRSARTASVRASEALTFASPDRQ
jgi:hypothetical protein